MKIHIYIKAMLYFLSCIVLLSACNNDKEKYPKLSTMHDEVMQVHDEVMPKITNIRKNVKALRAAYADEATTDAEKAEILTAIKLLEKADESMMGWMKDFEKPDYSKGKEAESYYEEEMTKISKVSDMMYKSIDGAEELLSSIAD